MPPEHGSPDTSRRSATARVKMWVMFRKVFVVYPRGMQTGGPEALHQLVDVLRSRGQEAVLVPRAGTEDRDRVAAYRVYDAPEERQVEDASDCAVVSPEDEPRLLSPYRRAQLFCWWLSIDNAAPFRDRQLIRNRWANRPPRPYDTLKMYARVPYHDVQRRLRGEHALLWRINHLAQSTYAAQFIGQRLGLTSRLLSDFTPLGEFDRRRSTAPSRRGAVVSFNPVKSGYLIDKLRPLVPEVSFRPLTGMTRVGVVDALGASVIHLDLGNHPGKDRMPREAALSDSIVIVGRRGSATVWEDVPLDDDFKVPAGPTMLLNAREAIMRALDDRDVAWRRQDAYRAVIRQERSRFESEAIDVFQGVGSVARPAMA